jgi:gamma-glutamylcyclotransferase (GGCT)/AIG2-like uncharacterized protein YtfP
MDFFAYGTLMCDDIMYGVIGCRPAQAPATLTNYRRYSVTGELYPGIVAKRCSTVKGSVYFDVPPQAWSRLDRFEGEMYSRCNVRVADADGKFIQAITYVVRPEFTHLLASSDWSYDDFLKSGKELFIADCFGSHEIYRDPSESLIG